MFVACLGLLFVNSASAQRQREYQMVSDSARNAGYSPAAYSSFETAEFSEGQGSPEDCETCGFLGGGGSQGVSLGGGLGILDRPGHFFFGADYLSVRSTFSESTAYVVSTGTATGAGGLANLGPPVTHQFVELDYDYEPSYRFYGGYRFSDCGGEIRFNYTRFDSNAGATSPPAVAAAVGSQVTQILHPGENALVLTGDNLSVSSNVSLNSYDLGFARTIPLGSPRIGSCGCGDGCADCCWCPAWDIKWSAGVRFAEVNWDRRAVTNSANVAINGGVRETTMDFDGGGARVGLEGTRYIGKKHRFALFAKGDMSLLLGTVDMAHTVAVPPTVGAAPVVNSTTLYSSTQIIPVLDIEVGGTVFLTDRLTFSGGYLFSAWHDLGMRDTFDVLEGTGPTFDDANILGFDGYFARAEFSF